MAFPENSGKRRKKNYYKDCFKKSRCGILQVGIQGILITCNHYEKECVKEAYNVLNEYAEILYGPEFKASDEASLNQSIEDQLEQELNELKSKKKKRRFQQVCTKVKNIIFIQAEVPDITKLVLAIFEDIKKIGQRKTRHIMKMTPVLSTCKCFKDDFQKCVAETIEQRYPNEESSLSYKINCKIRHNTGTDSAHMIWFCREAITKSKPKWRPTLDNPEVIIAIDVLQSICCIGILENYSIFKKYNLAEMVPIESSRKVDSDCSQVIDNKDGAKDSPTNHQLTEVDPPLSADATVVQHDSTDIQKVNDDEYDIRIFS